MIMTLKRLMMQKSVVLVAYFSHELLKLEYVY